MMLCTLQSDAAFTDTLHLLCAAEASGSDCRELEHTGVDHAQPLPQQGPHCCSELLTLDSSCLQKSFSELWDKAGG